MMFELDLAERSTFHQLDVLKLTHSSVKYPERNVRKVIVSIHPETECEKTLKASVPLLNLEKSQIEMGGRQKLMRTNSAASVSC